jgi:hypothetical protein
MSERQSVPPLSTTDRELSQLYPNLAPGCFIKALTEGEADGAETLRRMGRRYVAHADGPSRL